jgi:16S rRNA C967 or C1407 C5-methylase (RsmB/RsmF family)
LGHLKPGGKLLYSTCALSPEENEEVLAAVLPEFPDCNTLPIRTAKNSNLFMPPLLRWQGREFPAAVANAARVLPSITAEGFFLCLITRS